MSSHRQHARERKNLLRKRKRELLRKMLERPTLRAEARVHAWAIRNGLDGPPARFASHRLTQIGALTTEVTRTALVKQLERVRSSVERVVLRRMLRAMRGSVPSWTNVMFTVDGRSRASMGRAEGRNGP